MRFSLATTVLSLAAMAVAVPTDLLIARTSGDGCANIQGNVQCCNSVGNSDSSPGGLLGSIGNLNGLLQCVPLNLPILGAVLGSNGICSQGQQTCCIQPSTTAAQQSGIVNVNGINLPVANCLPISL
ncbi:hypothetical protein ACMFMG_003873 [Clarireedia jacksonii]